MDATPGRQKDCRARNPVSLFTRLFVPRLCFGGEFCLLITALFWTASRADAQQWGAPAYYQGYYPGWSAPQRYYYPASYGYGNGTYYPRSNYTYYPTAGGPSPG